MSLVLIVRSLLQPDFLSADLVAPICHRNRSSAEQDQSLPGNSSNNLLALKPSLCLKTLISIPSSLVKKHCFLRQPNASQKCNQHYIIIRNTSCSKYANGYFPYWKILFLSSIFKKLLLRNCAVDFVEICNVCTRKTIIKAAKRIINSDKMCRSYNDLNFVVTFWNTVYIEISSRIWYANRNWCPVVHVVKIHFQLNSMWRTAVRTAYSQHTENS